ncbi:hypothetical protein CF336_g1301 [Tilletia laevis]|uniref:Uncharacterized protein n=1 Tax=Tilletia caries TaxID=13290 RepID=A0A8T8TL82_9BASI|nr:hypothetical protein CF336_g1301 [Tilletia laevis]KAE8207944.1 hypothetical protein CF335_g776 [Tilletia laevis]KAE8261902.1 hypothetical protein A4X03_0g2874 [Tilletia caries]
MQIRRFSHLSFFLPVVLIGSIALAMVAGAPAPASADLEQHTAESFLKRTPPKLPNLEGMSLKGLQELLVSKEELYETHLKAMRNLELLGGTVEERKVAIDILRKDAVQVKAEIDAISNAINTELKSWGDVLHLGSR